MTFTDEQLKQIAELEAAEKKRQQAINNFLQRYPAPLKISEIGKGIRLCIENAHSLYADSALLFENRRHARSYTLSSFVIEEIGKSHILHAMCEIPTTNQAQWADAWREFRSHMLKFAFGRANIWTDQLYEQMGIMLSPGNDPDRRLGDRLRQLGIYVDYIQSDRRWGMPSEVNEKMAKQSLNDAAKVLKRVRYYCERGLFSEKYLALRQELCSNVYPELARVPESGEERSKWLLELHKVRKQFFQRLIEEGVLEQFNP